jgi:YHS domain-containing protein
MSTIKLSVLFAGLLALGVLAHAAEEKAKEFKATCPISGKAALEDKTVDYKGGKVYFCCPNCPKAFENDTAKFATKANQQLVATGQTTQAKCPLSGGPLNADASLEVGGAKVTFCCNNCKGKVAEATGDAQADLVFSDAAFKKAGFEVKKAAK